MGRTGQAQFNDDLFKDEEDKSKVMSLPEVEREMILFERQQRLEEVAEKRRLIEKVKALEGNEVAFRQQDAPLESKFSKPEEVIGINELNAIKNVVLSRKFIEAYGLHPEFNRIAKGCYVRLALSNGIYRLCEIVKIVKMKPYAVEQDVLIDKGALLRQGNSEKEFRFDVISNSPVNDAEVKYFASLDKLKKVKLSTLEAKFRELTELKRSPISDKTLEQILNEKKKLRGFEGIKEKVESIISTEGTFDSKKVRDYKYNTHTFLKLESNTNDPNDPFARRRANQISSTGAEQQIGVKENQIIFKFDPKKVYELHDFELDTSSINRIIS